MNAVGNTVAGGTVGIYVWRLRARFLTSSTALAQGSAPPSPKREQLARPVLVPMLVCPTSKDAQAMQSMVSANWKIGDPTR
jgi:hypothetical protein